MIEHICIHLFIKYIDDMTFNRLLCEFTIGVCQFNLSFCHILHVTGWVYAKHVLPILVDNPFFMHLMIVSEKDDVEPWDLAGNVCCGVFGTLVGNDSTIKPRMEKTKDKIRFLIVLNILHPFPCTAYHFLKLDTLPNGVVQPAWNCRCEQANNAYLHTIFIVNRVWL